MTIEEMIKKLKELNKNHKELPVYYKFDTDDDICQSINNIVFQDDKIIIVVEE